jgi:hypothetical protein
LVITARILTSKLWTPTTVIQRPTYLTTENMPSNVPWRDVLPPKAENITRIYALDVNRLTQDNRGVQFDSLWNLARETRTDIFCCQEHNILQTSMRNHLHHSCINNGSSPIPFQDF